VNFVDSNDGFQLHDNQPLYDEVDTLAWNLDIAISNTHGPLNLVGDIPRIQFETHRLPVDTFDKTGTQGTVNSDPSPDSLPHRCFRFGRKG